MKILKGKYSYIDISFKKYIRECSIDVGHLFECTTLLNRLFVTIYIIFIDDLFAVANKSLSCQLLYGEHTRPSIRILLQFTPK